MLCVNKLGLNWALRTQGSGAGPTWTLSRVFKEPFPPLEAAATEITREDSGSEEEPPVWKSGLASAFLSSACFEVRFSALWSPDGSVEKGSGN